MIEIIMINNYYIYYQYMLISILAIPLPVPLVGGNTGNRLDVTM